MNKPMKSLYGLLSMIARIPGLKWTERPIKVLIYTLEGFRAHGTMDMGAALTFYTIISLVPVLALVFAIMKGFGMTEALVDNLYGLLPQMPEVVDYIVNFANKALARTQGGVMALISLCMLFWAVISMFMSIENNFNKIWEVSSNRNPLRRYCDYIIVVIIAPLLWIMATSLGSTARELMGLDGSLWFNMLSRVLSLVVLWSMFAFVYMVLPNTRVHLRPALIAGGIAGTGFSIFQWIFIFIISRLTSYNAIYGSFAALPLFLLWVQWSWSIMLIGCELAFAIQNHERFDEERKFPDTPHDTSRKLMLAITLFVAGQLRHGQGSVTALEVRNKLGLTPRLVNKLLGQMVRAKVLNRVVGSDDTHFEESYALAFDLTTLKVCDIINALDMAGEPSDLCRSGELRISEKLMECIKEQCHQSQCNKLIRDIIDEQDERDS